MFNLGALLHQRGDMAGAERAYREVERLAPPLPRHRDGQSPSFADELSRAITNLSEDLGSAVFGPDLSEAFSQAAFNLGDLLESRGDLSEAASAYSRAEQRGVKRASLRVGLVLSKLGDSSGAEQAYSRAEQTGDSKAANNLGELLKQRGDLDAAERHYRRAVELGNDVASVNLGNLLIGQDRLDEAEAVWRVAASRNEDASFNLGLLLAYPSPRQNLSEARHFLSSAARSTDRTLAQSARQALKKLNL